MGVAFALGDTLFYGSPKLPAVRVRLFPALIHPIRALRTSAIDMIPGTPSWFRYLEGHYLRLPRQLLYARPPMSMARPSNPGNAMSHKRWECPL